ncbi:hypothetical protein RJ639_021478 [Escallonia herrerae]|uniref:tRNA-guanine(15) transglycosylase-like domain-containing protein n=1 Tax=Escallonia herrerae TaxID=1293975 RepID=A0AA88V446_9ASTE|nr:hypothetical protein RJ639_021478 [Escallonia herrerae]
MKFAVKAWSKNGRARVGSLHLGSCPHLSIEIETPALLLTTRKGLPVFISPDLLPSLPSPDSHLLQFSPLHFITVHGLSEYAEFFMLYSSESSFAMGFARSMEGLSTKTISNIGGLHQMLGLQEYGLAAVPRDSIVCLPEHESSNKMGTSFETPSGRHLIKPVEYMEMISSMKPNLYATLADEVPAWVSEKRNKASVDRTVRWLDDCLKLSTTGGAVFGSIVGGSSVEESQRCAQEVARRNDTFGVAWNRFTTFFNHAQSISSPNTGRAIKSQYCCDEFGSSTST